jgi:hypothetical protein
MTEEKKYTALEAHQAFAAGLNGVVWELLAQGERTREEDDRMLHAAHASCYHWLKVGTPVHRQRGEWLLTHVYSEMGIGEAALRHAKRCWELTEAHPDLMEDFDLAYGHEGLARGHAAAGDLESARKEWSRAETAGEAIADEENRKMFVGDMRGGIWHGLL